MPMAAAQKAEREVLVVLLAQSHAPGIELTSVWILHNLLQALRICRLQLLLFLYVINLKETAKLLYRAADKI